MPNSMRVLIYSNFLLLLLLLLLNFIDTTGADTDAEILTSEHVALIKIRRRFNNSLLNANWTGQHCSFNQTTWIGLRCINNRVTAISLESIGLSCVLENPLLLEKLSELTLVSFKNNSITGNMTDFSFNHKIATIDLSMNQLTGPISESLLNLTLLESLQLHHNNFSGNIPPLNQSSLKELNVSYNRLSGEIPTTVALQSISGSSYTGNPDLCGSPSPNPCPKREREQTSSLLKAVFIAVGGILLFVVFSSIFIVSRRRRRAKKSVATEKSGAEVGEEEAVTDEKISTVSEEQRTIIFVAEIGGFDLDDILKASAQGLGKGGFGGCYKAMLEDGREFVIKRLTDVSPMTKAEFKKQMGVLGEIEHPNLLSLLGYYHSMEVKFLIYHLAQNGNLFDRIHGNRGDQTRTPFKWSSRLAVAKAVAQAMEFLHRNPKASSPIPHGNLKSSNVLLSTDDIPLVCDYGLLPLFPAPLATQRMVAYRSPEYQYTRKISRKSDVWSFGCLLLELLTGKILAHSSPQGIEGAELVNWVHRSVREEWTAEVFDAEILVQRGATGSAFNLLRVALRCCDRSTEKRPEMGQVAKEMEGIAVSDGEDESVSADASFVDESVSADASGSTK